MQGITDNGYIHNHTFKSLLLQEKEEVKVKGFVGFFNITPPPYFRIFNTILCVGYSAVLNARIVSLKLYDWHVV